MVTANSNIKVPIMTLLNPPSSPFSKSLTFNPRNRPSNMADNSDNPNAHRTCGEPFVLYVPIAVPMSMANGRKKSMI